MWIFKNNAFVSIVQDKDMDDQLWVRGRIRGDIERFLGGGDFEVLETNDADYRFRIPLSREAVRPLIGALVDDITYVNFKGSIAEDRGVEDERHNAYMRAWQAMMGFQRWFKNREQSKDDWWQDDDEASADEEE